MAGPRLLARISVQVPFPYHRICPTGEGRLPVRGYSDAVDHANVPLQCLQTSPRCQVPAAQRLKPLVGKRLNPEAFKSVRTVQDVADALARLVNDPAPI